MMKEALLKENIDRDRGNSGIWVSAKKENGYSYQLYNFTQEGATSWKR